MQEAKEHYELLKEDYQKQVEKLTKLVDGAVDPVDFMKASGTSARIQNTCTVVTMVYASGQGCVIVNVGIYMYINFYIRVHVHINIEGA